MVRDIRHECLLTLILSALKHSWKSNQRAFSLLIPEISYLKHVVFVCFISLRIEILTFWAFHFTIPLCRSQKLFYSRENEIEQGKWGLKLFYEWRKGKLIRIKQWRYMCVCMYSHTPLIYIYILYMYILHI